VLSGESVGRPSPPAGEGEGIEPTGDEVFKGVRLPPVGIGEGFIGAMGC